MSRARAIAVPFRLRDVVVARRDVAVTSTSRGGGGDGGEGDGARARLAPAPASAWVIHGAAVDESSSARAREAASAIESRRGVLSKAWGVIDGVTGANAAVARATDYGSRAWRDMALQRPGTIKRRIYDLGMYAMDRIDPSEYTIRGMPQVVTSMEIVYPSTANAADVRAAVEETLKTATSTARKATWFNAIGVPLSLPMFLSPVSNFPIYWFGFRLWNTTAAVRSGREALQALRSTSSDDAVAIEAKVKDLARGGDAIVECKRLRPINCLNSDTGQEVSTTDEPHAVACCRLSQAGGEALMGDNGPRVLFVPCDALAKVVSDDCERDELSEGAASKVERLFGASGVVDFVRRRKKYEEIYLATKSKIA